MKKLLAAICLLCALSLPVLAGGIEMGKQEPPPCNPETETCTQASSTEETSTSADEGAELAALLIILANLFSLTP